jgi:hypothetical protein
MRGAGLPQGAGGVTFLIRRAFFWFFFDATAILLMLIETEEGRMNGFGVRDSVRCLTHVLNTQPI